MSDTAEISIVEDPVNVEHELSDISIIIAQEETAVVIDSQSVDVTVESTNVDVTEEPITVEITTGGTIEVDALQPTELIQGEVAALAVGAEQVVATFTPNIKRDWVGVMLSGDRTGELIIEFDGEKAMPSIFISPENQSKTDWFTSIIPIPEDTVVVMKVKNRSTQGPGKFEVGMVLYAVP